MAGTTDIGRERKYNQDSYYCNANLGIAIIADGIGGRKGGEVASRIFVDGVKQYFIEIDKIRQDEIKNFLLASFDKVNLAIMAEGQKKEHLTGMGTTALCVVFAGNQVFVGHIGDSRCYLYYKGHLFQVTIDHNVGTFLKQGWMKQNEVGSQARSGSLVKALGLTPYIEMDIYSLRPETGEIIITCTDGLYSMVSDQRILELVHKNRHDIENLPNILVKEANAHGGRDNITVIATEVRS